MEFNLRKEFEELPIEEKLKKLDKFQKIIAEEKNSILASSFYCEKCKTYHDKSDVKTTSRVDLRTELTRLFGFEVCPICGWEKVKDKIYLYIENENRR